MFDRNCLKNLFSYISLSSIIFSNLAPTDIWSIFSPIWKLYKNQLIIYNIHM